MEEKRVIVRDTFISLSAVILSLVLYFVFTGTEQREEAYKLSLYCEMVDTHKKYPKYGWPDYKGIYNTQCKKKKEELK